MEDNISNKIYDEGFKTADKYSSYSDFDNSVSELFENYIKTRTSNLTEELNKNKNTELV